jgi:threonine/homoserine/homoserine lactone efflux protein
MAGMSRRFWIAGLTFALLVWGGVTLGILYETLTHQIDAKGWLMVAGNGYIMWITFQYLRTKLSPTMRPFKRRDTL